MMDNNTNNIPIEKFRFADRNDLYHDSKFETKPVSYFQGAFKRFSKNKGAVVGGIVIAVLVLFAIFQTHYFQRSFIFPLLIRGNSKMPVGIMLMGAVFNTLNALMQGGWIFYLAPQQGYYDGWMSKPYIYIGAAIWLAGFIINLHSDYIIRHLRKPGDTKHYIPRGGMFRYVSSANYFGEFTEWVGFAVASWSWAGVVFAMWTFANLGPRAASLYKRYESEFGEEFTSLKRKRIIPFIY